MENDIGAAGVLDTTDLRLLAYMANAKVNSFLMAETAQEIAEQQGVKLKKTALWARFRKLVGTGLVAEGIKTKQQKGYYITQKGEEFARQVDASTKT